jgi:hypothetical protein
MTESFLPWTRIGQSEYRSCWYLRWYDVEPQLADPLQHEATEVAVVASIHSVHAEALAGVIEHDELGWCACHREQLLQRVACAHEVVHEDVATARVPIIHTFDIGTVRGLTMLAEHNEVLVVLVAEDRSRDDTAQASAEYGVELIEVTPACTLDKPHGSIKTTQLSMREITQRDHLLSSCVNYRGFFSVFFADFLPADSPPVFFCP